MSRVNATLQYFETSKGVRLYYQKWMPDQPRGIIVFVHGMGDHVGRYNAFTSYFATHGYGICLFDMRGHGKSDGRRTHVNSFYDYLFDLSEFIRFIKKRSPKAPIFLVGHSFGGQVVLNFVVRYTKEIRGVIALSPSIAISLDIPKWKVHLGKIGTKLFPIARLKHEINPELLSHDPKVIEDYISDSNVRHDITIRCGYEILKNTELVMALAGRIHLPVMLMHGGADRICDPEATKKFYMRVPVVNKELKIYPEMYHELLNETNRSDVFSDMASWIEKQLGQDGRLAGARFREASSQ